MNPNQGTGVWVGAQVDPLLVFVGVVGGKTQIIDKIIDNFPTNINNYHELFLGGGSVLLALLSMQKNNKININGSINAYDINPILINMFVNIRDNPEEIYKYIKKLLYHFNKITVNNVNNISERKIKHIEKITSKENFYYWYFHVLLFSHVISCKKKYSTLF